MNGTFKTRFLDTMLIMVLLGEIANCNFDMVVAINII